MNVFETIDNGCIYIFDKLANVNTKDLTAKEKYDMLKVTAGYQTMIMNAFEYFGKGSRDYKHKIILLDNGISIDMREVEFREQKMLKARFVLVDLQKELLGINDLMLEGAEAIERLKKEII